MRKIVISLLLLVGSLLCFAQDPLPYNPNADAKADIKKAVQQAKTDNKHVLIQVGGNWCPWCLRFHKMATSAYAVDSIIKKDYVYILVNYSKENKNMDVMKDLEYPNRFGFPVFVILDGNGKRLHTQDSGLLEHNKAKGYDTTKVVTFLREWDVKAVDPKTYTSH
ncbi:MAG: thioredoxin family protein [Methanoregula sp.]|nr:thioredoxin family protein [Bacteroidota bacterium]MCX6696998.1 thioredoxin family protein [Methanoregula sp.]